ncbi:50S ribosomal protein L25 [Tissierella sp. MSJ-40]|uniref:Large ribosomal subunit protein bL25 n=1 Tax=Tissierella simiarum TaxID=2841534 RepID=A0ABS6E2R0_9FIRM|nr:50S ribosomal protein L25 [Tissierella simiarum]MBU5437067.1 50S ribosomal protein L25 [Tissierella simiarum]
MSAIKMQVEKRNETGKNRVDKMRDKDFIPGVIYSKGEETQNILVDTAEFLRVYKTAGASSLLDLQLEGKSMPAIIKEIQKHPFKNQYIHVDFQKLNMNEKVKMTVPIVLVGRDSIKLQPSILMQLLDEIEIECLPGNIPQSVEVEVSDMDFSTPIFVKDLNIAQDENITILRDLEDVVCTLAEPSKAAEANGEGEEENTTAEEPTEKVEE